jgi:hypothetical protein
VPSSTEFVELARDLTFTLRSYPIGTLISVYPKHPCQKDATRRSLTKSYCLLLEVHAGSSFRQVDPVLARNVLGFCLVGRLGFHAGKHALPEALPEGGSSPFVIETQIGRSQQRPESQPFRRRHRRGRAATIDHRHQQDRIGTRLSNS